MSKTAASIRADLAALDARVAEVEDQAAELSLAAVSGDEEARKLLAALLREIAQLRAERSILEIAMEQARLREVDAGREIDAAERERHLAAARDAAARLLAAGEQAEEMVASFVACIEVMDSAERAIHSALRASGEPINVGRGGRHQIAAIARERMQAASTGKLLRMSDQRSLQEILSAAWSDLPAEDAHHV